LAAFWPVLERDFNPEPASVRAYRAPTPHRAGQSDNAIHRLNAAARLRFSVFGRHHLLDLRETLLEEARIAFSRSRLRLQLKA